MLEQSSKNRPSAAELFATLPPGQCCLLANNASDSQSYLGDGDGLNEGNIIPRDLGAIVHQNFRQSGILEDDISTEAIEKTFQRNSTSVKYQDSSLSQICDSSGSLKLVSSRNTNWWDACYLMTKRTKSNIFLSFLAITTFIGALLLSLNSYATPSSPEIWSKGPQVPSLATATWRSKIKSVAYIVEQNKFFDTFTNNWTSSIDNTETSGDLSDFYPSRPFDAEHMESESEWPSSIDLTFSQYLRYVTYSSSQNYDSNLDSGQEDCLISLDQTSGNASGLIHISPEDTSSNSDPFQSSPREWTGRRYSPCYNYSTIEYDLSPSSIIKSVDDFTTWYQGSFQTYSSASPRIDQMSDYSSFKVDFVQSLLQWVIAGAVLLLATEWKRR
jgi:hypothetical protein